LKVKSKITDCWKAAVAAAMEEKVRSLEKENEKLRAAVAASVEKTVKLNKVSV
jgi:hypothetical protein